MKSRNSNSSQRSEIIFGCIRFVPKFLIILILINLGCQPLAVQEKKDIAPPTGTELFQSKCGKCHDPEVALKEYRSARVWYDTIRRMREEHDADVDQEEMEVLVQYHVDRQKHDAAIFNEKCQKCHPGKVFLEQNLSADQARAIIKRMQQKAGNSIEDKDVDIIVRYHVQFHQAALEDNLRGVFNSAIREKTGGKFGIDMVQGVSLFLEKCSSCHEPERALTVFKDPQVWAQTIKRMQYYSKGGFTDEEAEMLVDFHVNEQQRELNTFNETCTKCHDTDRINSRSMSDLQWLEIIRRMQKKAPELIPDEKINLLAAYFHRRELTMAKIFYNRCWLCHADTSGGKIPVNTTFELNRFIVLANEEIGEGLQVTDAKNLLSAHAQRQKRNMQIFEINCNTCHPDDLPTEGVSAGGRSRAEWISYIAILQGMELNKEVQESINSQIDYHISKY